jgi:hypothetical protein
LLHLSGQHFSTSVNERDDGKFETSLSYIVRPYLKKLNIVRDKTKLKFLISYSGDGKFISSWIIME